MRHRSATRVSPTQPLPLGLMFAGMAVLMMRSVEPFAPLAVQTTGCHRGVNAPPTFSSSLCAKPSADDDEDDRLSSLDARVLQSMLRDDDKLDLGTEQNMKKLLERGVAPKNAPTFEQPVDPNGGDDDDGEYASKVLKVRTHAHANARNKRDRD